MRKSTTKMLSMILAFLMAFSSLSMPAVAAPVDGVDAVYEEATATEAEVLADTESEADKAAVVESESVDVNDEGIEADESNVTEETAADAEEIADEEAIEEEVEVAEEAMQEEEGIKTITVPEIEVTAYTTSYRTKYNEWFSDLGYVPVDIFPIRMVFNTDEYDQQLIIQEVKIDGEIIEHGNGYININSWSGYMIPDGEATYGTATIGLLGDYTGEKHTVELRIADHYKPEYTTKEYIVSKKITFAKAAAIAMDPEISNYTREIDYSRSVEKPYFDFRTKSDITKVELVNRVRSYEVDFEIGYENRNSYAPEYGKLKHIKGNQYCDISAGGFGEYSNIQYRYDAENVPNGDYYLRITTEDGKVYSYENKQINVAGNMTGIEDINGQFGYTVPDVKTVDGKGDFFFLAYKPVSETGANYKPTSVRVYIDGIEIDTYYRYGNEPGIFRKKWEIKNGIAVTQVRLRNMEPGTTHQYKLVVEDETGRVQSFKVEGDFEVADAGELICEKETEMDAPYVAGTTEDGIDRNVYFNATQLIQTSVDNTFGNSYINANSIVLRDPETGSEIDCKIGTNNVYASAYLEVMPLYSGISIAYDGKEIPVSDSIFRDCKVQIESRRYNYNIGIRAGAELEVNTVYDLVVSGIYHYHCDGNDYNDPITFTIKNAVVRPADGIDVSNLTIGSSYDPFVAGSSLDYIAVSVYSRQVDKLTLTPKLYMDKELAEDSLAAYYDESDPNCYISPVTNYYRTYKLKTTPAYKNSINANIYGSFNDSSVRVTNSRAYVTKNGITAIDLTDRKPGLIYKSLFMKSPVKICRLYIYDAYAEYLASKGNRLDAMVSIFSGSGSAYKTERIHTTMIVSTDEEGRLYAEIPANSELYNKIAGSGVWACEVYDEDNTFLTNIVTSTGSTSTDVKSGSYRIVDSFDMNHELIASRASSVKLTNSELDMLSKYPSVILVITDDTTTYTREVKYTSPYRDSIVYELGADAENATGNPELVFKGESVNSLMAPTRAHYTFEGWYYDMAYTKPVVFPIKGLGGKQKTLYAKWKANVYTVSMYTIVQDNKGEMSTQSETISAIWGETFYLRLENNTKLVKDGYKVDKFIGEHGKVYSADEPVTIEKFENDGNLNNDRVSLQINTSPIDYTITYDLNGAPGRYDEYITSEYKTSYTVNDSEYTVPAPVKTDVAGMTFDRWYSDSSLTKAVSKIGGKKLDNITLFAKWVPKTYTLKFDVDLTSYPGAKVTSIKTIPSVEHRVGETFVLPANVFALAPSDSTIKNKYVFAGWSVKKDKNAADPMADKSLVCIDDDILEGKDEITLYAHFAVTNTDTYEIKYDLDLPDIIEGTSKLMEQVKWSADDEYTYGVAKKLSAVPSIPGYDFAGWINTANGKKVTSITAKDMGDIFLKATWKERTYKVVVDGNGAKQKNINWTVKFTDHYNYFDQKDVFTKDGYYFNCWELYLPDGNIKTTNLWDSVVGTAALDETIGQLKNGSKLTYKVNWKITPYRLQFKTNGAEAIEDMDYTYSTTAIELPVPEKAGYTFLGWATDEACKKVIAKYNTKTKKALLPAKTFGVDTLYAVWECNYSIVFHSADGTKEKKVSGFKVGVPKPLPANPFGTKYKRVAPWGSTQMADYVFTGWKVGSKRAYEKYADKATIDGSDLMPTDLVDGEYVLHLYAGEMNYYSSGQDTYTLQFSSVSGPNFYPSGYMKPVKGTVGKVLKLPKCSLKIDNAVCVGWTTEPKLSFDENDVIYKDGGEFFNMMGGTNPSSYVYLYPVWRKTFDIKLEKNAEDARDLEIEKYTYNYGTSLLADSLTKMAAPSRYGYDFAGWYTDAACKKAFKNITKTTSGDFTLYAKWTPKKYTVKYISDAPGTTGKVKDQTVTYGTSVKLSKNTFARVGYQFAGWKKGDSIIEYTSASVYPDNGVMTLVATWTPVKSTITYKNAEYCMLNNDTEFDSPEGYVLKTPVKPGYAFKGWYSDAKCTRKVTEYAPGKPGKYTVYAKWELNTK